MPSLALLLVALQLPGQQAAPPPAPEPAQAASGSLAEQARARAAAGDHAGAVTLLQDAVAANANDGPAWYQLGYSLHALKRYDEALPAHERAATFPAFAAKAGYNAACALALLGRGDEAFARLAAAIRAGFGDRKLLAVDSDLDSLRDDPRFATLLPPRLDGAAAFAEPVRVLHELTGRAGGEEFGWVARALGDLDGDGAPDLVLDRIDGPVALGMNRRRGSAANWLVVRCQGPARGEVLEGAAEGRTPVDGLGARVRVVPRGAAAPTLMAEVQTGVGYASASSAWPCFALGTGSGYASLEVHWPSGRVERLGGGAGGRVVTVREGRGIVAEEPLR